MFPLFKGYIFYDFECTFLGGEWNSYRINGSLSTKMAKFFMHFSVYCSSRGKTVALTIFYRFERHYLISSGETIIENASNNS